MTLPRETITLPAVPAGAMASDAGRWASGSPTSGTTGRPRPPTRRDTPTPTSAIEVDRSDRDAADALVEDLFVTEGRSLVRLARIFCDDRDAAEDLVQEAFIRLHRSASSIRDASRAPAFLRSIVINLARDHNRRGLMSLRHQRALPQASADPGIEDAAIADADHETLNALRELPDRQRSCVVLRYYLDLSERDIADTLGISKNSVKTHTRRGLAALERRLTGPADARREEKVR